jgi:hypothetical protein
MREREREREKKKREKDSRRRRRRRWEREREKSAIPLSGCIKDESFSNGSRKLRDLALIADLIMVASRACGYYYPFPFCHDGLIFIRPLNFIFRVAFLADGNFYFPRRLLHTG